MFALLDPPGAAETPDAVVAPEVSTPVPGSGVPLDGLRAAAEVSLPLVSDEGLLAQVTELEAARRLVDAAEARLLGEIEARSASDVVAGLKTKPWLRHACRVSGVSASRRVNVAKTLRRWLPNVIEAVVAGQISMDHAEVLARACNPRIAERIAFVSWALIQDAATMNFATWKAYVEHIVRQFDEDGGHDPASDPSSNQLRLTDSLDGLVELHGQLVPVDGEFVRQTLAERADRLYERAVSDAKLTPDLPIPSRATLLANALVDLLRDAVATDRASSTPGSTEVTLVVEATAAHTDDSIVIVDGQLHLADNAPVPAGDWFTGTTWVWRTLTLADRAARGPAVFTPTGKPLPHGCADHLLCDAAFTTIIRDSLGVPLDAGRTVRFANRAQRRALRVRDGGCIFPGCEAEPHWTDAHHLIEWFRGGMTDLVNLASLCRHHHGVIHRTGWTLTPNRDGWFTITTPSGQTLASQRHGRQRPRTPRQPPDPPG